MSLKNLEKMAKIKCEFGKRKIAAQTFLERGQARLEIRPSGSIKVIIASIVTEYQAQTESLRRPLPGAR